MSSLEGRVMFLSGGSRGIGLAIALRAARDGARVALMAKTAEPHPKLPGTIYTAAEEIVAAGGEALPMVGDIRDAQVVEAAVAQAVDRFGGIDIVLNNASAINLAPMRDLPVKRFDLMQQINSRGTFVVTRAALPHLRESSHPHVLTLSPPLSADPRWLAGHSAYTLSKMGMTMITLGLATDEAEAGIGANRLWPRTIIATAAVQNLLGGDEAMRCSPRRASRTWTATPPSRTPTCRSTSSWTGGRRACRPECFPPKVPSMIGRARSVADKTASAVDASHRRASRAPS